jgi:hypothetical protein
MRERRKIENVDPRVTMLRTDNEEPMCTKSKIESLDP